MPEAVSIVTGNQTASAINPAADTTAYGETTIARETQGVAGIVAQLREQSTHRRFRRTTGCKNAFRRLVPSSKRANELRAPLELREGPPGARANPILIHVPSAQSHLRSRALARKAAASSIQGDLFL